MSFDMEPDGDPHGECALEIKQLQSRIDTLTQDLLEARNCTQLEATISALERRESKLLEVLKTWHKLAVNLATEESNKNQIRKQRLGLKENQFEITGEFALNRAWRDFAIYEETAKAVLTEMETKI